MNIILSAGAILMAAMQSYPTAVDAPEDMWRAPDPENVLYIDVEEAGRIVIELYPDFAPAHVERIKTLARRGFYDGVVFHRVIPGFMAQGGDPNGTGAGGSDLPDLKLEAALEVDGLAMTTHFGAGPGDDPGRTGHRRRQAGFNRALPIFADGDDPEKTQTNWISHCRGVVSMARKGSPVDSANSQFFIMFDAAPHLDTQYSAWGRVIWGMPAVDEILNLFQGGTKPVMEQVRIAADVPAAERTEVEVLDTGSEAFRVWLTRQAGSSDIDVCAVEVPSRLSSAS